MSCSRGYSSRTARPSSAPSPSSSGGQSAAVAERPTTGTDWMMVAIWGGAALFGCGFWAAVALVAASILGGAW